MEATCDAAREGASFKSAAIDYSEFETCLCFEAKRLEHLPTCAEYHRQRLITAVELRHDNIIYRLNLN